MSLWGRSLMSKHQTSSEFKKEENAHTDLQIHDRDYEWLMDCDLVIAEISNPSLGVGGEISDAINFKKPVLMIFQEEIDKEFISAYSRGKVGSRFVNCVTECKGYKNMEDLKEVIIDFLKIIKK